MKFGYILHLAKWYPNREDDLEGIFIKRHLECISDNHRSVVLYLRPSNRILKHRWYELEIIHNGQFSEWIGYYNKRVTGIKVLDKILKFIYYYCLSYKLFKEIVRQNGLPDFILVHVMLRTALFAKWVLMTKNIPYAIVEHHTLYLNLHFGFIEKLKNFIRKYVVTSANGIITVSYQLEQAMKKHGLSNKHYYQVFNAVDTSIFYPKPKQNRSQYYLLHVSEFIDHHKNITGLLQAFKIAQEKSRSLRLILVGYGQDFPIVNRTIFQLGLSQLVTLIPKTTGSGLADLFRNADLFVLFSHKENMPCVLAESLCCGTPFISSDVGGIREIADKDYTVLVPAGNIDALVHHIVEFAKYPFVPDPFSISKDANERFSNTAVAKKWDQVIQLLFPTAILKDSQLL